MFGHLVKPNALAWKLLLLIGALMALTACGGGNAQSNTQPVQVVAVSVSPATANISVSATQQFTATVTGTPNTAVNWSVNEANGGAIDNTGNYTAPLRAGAYHVTATSQADSTKSATVAITVTAPAPTFGSTAPTDAVEATLYSYTIDATDPAGTGVSLVLDSAPEGAALNGNTISWTPTWDQSRKPHAFSVTATTDAGGTATQSWSVAPNGTIHGTNFSQWWASDGTVTTVPNWSTETTAQLWTAYSPLPDGTLQAYPGQGFSDGTFVIPNVPAGGYWLRVNPYAADLLWETSSTLTWDTAQQGINQKPYVGGGFTTQNLAFALVGLDSWDPISDTLQGYCIDQVSFMFLYTGGPFISEGATAYSARAQTRVEGVPNQSCAVVHFVGLNDLKPPFAALTPAGQIIGFSAGPILDLELSMVTNDATTSIMGELTRSNSQPPLHLEMKFSKWQQMFADAGPTTATPVEMDNFVTSVFLPKNAEISYPAIDDLPTLASAAVIAQKPGWSMWPQDASGNDTWPQDGNYGSLPFNVPFQDISQYVLYAHKMYATYSIPIPNSTAAVSYAAMSYSYTPYPLADGIEPIASGVTNPKIEAADLFTQATTVGTTTPTLSWGPPSTIDNASRSWHYSVDICEVSAEGDSGTCSNASFPTFNYITQQSFTVPTGLLQAGHSYIFSIVADSRQDWEPARPRIYGFPDLVSQVVSAVITVDSSATGAGAASVSFTTAGNGHVSGSPKQLGLPQWPIPIASGTTAPRSSEQLTTIEMLEQRGVYIPRIVREKWQSALHYSPTKQQ